ncbi:MAG: GYD domain-containing protein [Rhodospirillales bacterium]|nr:GYD domain-containing protein [Rhodospirillales bacterium]
MLFSITGEYTPQALNAMWDDPHTNRQAAAQQLVEAAGGKLIAFYGRPIRGPGILAIFDVGDPDMAAAISATVVSAGTLHHVEMTRLFTQDDIVRIRQKRRQIGGAYKPPGRA